MFGTVSLILAYKFQIFRETQRLSVVAVVEVFYKQGTTSHRCSLAPCARRWCGSKN